ncbi:MAG: hypothetical protein MUO76_10385 [Anaerolineaceae bacterium]|nr:hypothetical protein [Anaerolineaceae bacterium]
MEEEIKSVEGEVEISQPIILNLGKQNPKRIKRMMKGKGKLWNEVEGVIDEVGTTLGDELEGKIIVPLILVYRRKPKRRRALRMLGLR